LTTSDENVGLVYYKRRANGTFKKSMYQGSSFYDLVHFRNIQVTFGVEVNPDTGKANLRKITNSDWIYKIKGLKVYYNEKPGKQLRKNTDSTLLGVTTAKNRIQILNNLDKTKPDFLSEVLIPPKSFISDFKFLNEDHLVMLTDSGKLNMFKI
jgi:hypothetical protein